MAFLSFLQGLSDGSFMTLGCNCLGLSFRQLHMELSNHDLSFFRVVDTLP
jgi:hypothetical protein